MNVKDVWVVKYNDCYGNGDDTRIEAVLHSEKDFKKWLKKHNQERKELGGMKESKEEFDLIRVNLLTFD